jgi:hypothetical protein
LLLAGVAVWLSGIVITQAVHDDGLFELEGNIADGRRPRRTGHPSSMLTAISPTLMEASRLDSSLTTSRPKA